MDQALVDVFEQARKVVAEEDRKIAEEEERRRECEREKVRQVLGARMEEAFDFTSKEKLEGLKTEQASRRLAAARVVTAVGNWVQNVKATNGRSQAVANTRQQAVRWEQERDESRPEPTYGTMGSFLGVKG